jgi:sugar phosphate isomerase/epimerase
MVQSAAKFSPPNLLGLASGVLPEFGALDVIRAAAESGWDGAGLWVEPDEWTPALTRQCRHDIASAGLSLIDAEVIWLKPDSSDDDHRRSIDIAMELGALNFLCVSSHRDHAASAERLRMLCEHATGNPIRIALEFGVFTEVKDISAARAIVEMVDHPAAAILVDPIHVDRSASAIADIAALPARWLPYAQFCDARAQRPDPADFDAVIIDAVDLREQAGEGALPLRAIYDALPKGIPITVELRSKALRDQFPDPVKRASAVLNATRKWFAGEGLHGPLSS